MGERLIYMDVFKWLDRERVRYLVVGGFAVVLYGWTRFTKDLDLMIDIDDKENVMRFIKVMKKLRYNPLIPVRIEDIADEEIRKKWVLEKNALVLSFGDFKNPLKRIDVFLDNPIDFNRAYIRKRVICVERVKLYLASIDDIINMKKNTARSLDMEDIEKLRVIKREGKWTR